MYNTQNLLDIYKQKIGVSSDYALSLKLGISRQKISDYRAGRHSLGDDRAIVIAEECGLDAGLVLVSMQAERAQKQDHTKTADILKSLFDRLSGATAAIILAALLFTPETGMTKVIDLNDQSPANPHRMGVSPSATPLTVLRHNWHYVNYCTHIYQALIRFTRTIAPFLRPPSLHYAYPN